MRRHPARLQAAGISPGRYEELKGFCRQYREYARTLRRARAGIVDRPERAGGTWHAPDPTASAAQALADHPCARRVRLIEECAASVAEPEVARAIVKSVSEGASFGALRPPVGERQFYILRQLFFIELDRRLWRT